MGVRLSHSQAFPRILICALIGFSMCVLYARSARVACHVSVSCCKYHRCTAVRSVTLENKAADFVLLKSSVVFRNTFPLVCVMRSRVCSSVLAGFRLNNVSPVGSRARRLSRGRRERERERDIPLR